MFIKILFIKQEILLQKNIKLLKKRRYNLSNYLITMALWTDRCTNIWYIH